MEISNSNPTPVPEATEAPAVAPVSAEALAGSVPETGTPKASPSTGGLGAGAPAPIANMEIPKTTATTVGGWNRFAGYNPKAAKDKQKDGRGGSKGRR